jgi:hypothetical protein
MRAFAHALRLASRENHAYLDAVHEEVLSGQMMFGALGGKLGVVYSQATRIQRAMNLADGHFGYSGPEYDFKKAMTIVSNPCRYLRTPDDYARAAELIVAIADSLGTLELESPPVQVDWSSVLAKFTSPPFWIFVLVRTGVRIARRKGFGNYVWAMASIGIPAWAAWFTWWNCPDWGVQSPGRAAFTLTALAAGTGLAKTASDHLKKKD